ncbi:MAG: S41 family peptidase [Chloroflexi bacterium]|nr:S41 family peptidase [Chloroflexota bacterium]
MLTKVIQVLIGAILITAVGAASYFGGWEQGRRATSPATASAAMPSGTSAAEIGDAFNVFWEAWSLVEKEFYKPDAVDAKKMTYGAVKGMLEALGDPYTSFATPAHAQINDEDIRGSFDGIGVVVEMRDKRLTVVAPQEDGPGAKAGVKPGDIIVRVDDKEITNMTLLEAVSLIRGPRGTKVRLTIIRTDERAPIVIEVTRAQIRVVNVRTKNLEDGIAYVKLNGFAATTSRELAQTLRQIVDQKPKALIFDLRNNPGGLLSTSVDIASLFLREGVILYEEHRDGSSTPFYARRNAVAPDVPMIILVNKGSASASEIVAGALQDHGRAILIGEPTFGKDSIQNVHELSDKSSVRITIARYSTPKRQDFHEKGLQPDIEIKLTEDDLKNDRDPQLQRAIEFLQGRSELTPPLWESTSASPVLVGES